MPQWFGILVAVLYLISLHGVWSDCTISNVPTSYTVAENTMATLLCATTGNESTNWYSSLIQLSNQCTSLRSTYTVMCNLNAGQYNLTFNATWSNRGLYTCSCFPASQTLVVDVEVPIKLVSATCTVAATGRQCSEQTLEDADRLVIKAMTSCTYPNPTFSWFRNQTSVDVSSYQPVITEMFCTGNNNGQRIVVQTFNASWRELGTPARLEVLVQRARALSVVASISFNSDLVYGFAAAKVAGLVLGVACAVGGVTAGTIGLKKTVSKNFIKPKPQQFDHPNLAI